MGNTYEEVVSAALSLSPEARAVLAEQLLASLETSQEEVHAAWRVEIERRVKEIEEGRVRLIPGEQVMSELRAQLKR
ncbi:MAG: addiction module protein [Pyrinomonadaceae bacterium]